MRSKNIQKKTNDRPLKWFVRLIFAGIVLAGLVLMGLVFRWQGLAGLPFVPAPETSTQLSLVPPSTLQPDTSMIAEPSAAVGSNPRLPVADFDPSTANPVAPADVLNEVNYFGGGGGGGTNGCEEPSTDGLPYWGIVTDRAEWLSPVYISSCAWQPGETITLTVSHEGSVYATENLQLEDNMGAVAYFLPLSSSMGVGDYTIVMASPRARLETTVTIFLPSTPRLYPVKDEGLVLYSFVPNETVRLFAYQMPPGVKLQLAGWSPYQVDATGKLIIHAPADGFLYYVVGDRSGFIEMSPRYSRFIARPIVIAPCAGRASYVETRYYPPGNASIEATTFLRTAPGDSYETVSSLDKGTLVSVTDGPVCAEASAWWYVDAGNGVRGWMPEYQGDVYLLSPYPKDTVAQVAGGLPDLEFDLDAANQIAPEEVFDQVIFFGKGAGFCEKPPYPTPTVTEAPRGGELFTESTLTSCGWEQGELLKGTVQYPDGHALIRYIKTSGTNDRVLGELSFTPTLLDPPGTYTFTLEGQQGSVSATAEFQAPQGPHIYTMDASHILLYHFTPGEQVRLLCYSGDSRFRAWQDLVIDPSGNQPVKVETFDCAFVALGGSSGEVHQVRDVTGTVQKTCGGLTTRFSDLHKARVAFTDGSARPLRTLPGNSAEATASLPEGTTMVVAGLPHCVDGNLWWFVYPEGGGFGWMPEEQNGVYLLEPAP